MWLVLLLFSCQGVLSVTKLRAYDEFKGDQFGYSVSLYKNSLAISAVGDDDCGGYSGSVYTYQSVNGGWSLKSKLIPPDGETDGYFGMSLGQVDGTLAIGAYQATVGASEYYAGAVYIYNTIGSSWTLTAKLTASDAKYRDYFGHSLGIYGNLLVIGADGDENKTQISDSGSAYVYSRPVDSLSWSFRQKLIFVEANMWAGKAVSIYDNTILVSKTGDAMSAGAIFVYTGDVISGWTRSSLLIASDRSQNDYFGMSMSLFDDQLAVGAYLDDDKGIDSGSVYMFGSLNGQWTQQAKLTARVGMAADQYGWSVSLFGDNLIVGVPQDDDQGLYSGSIYMYHRDNGKWSQSAYVIPEKGLANTFYGYSVSLYESAMAISAYKSDDAGTDSGSAYVYNVSFLPTASPTSSPSSTPTFRPSVVPSSLPTTHPTSSPSTRPTYIPSVSFTPTYTLQSGIHFQVQQVVGGLDYSGYQSDVEGSDQKFIQSVSNVVADLTYDEIQVENVIPLTKMGSISIQFLSTVIFVYNVTHLLPGGTSDSDAAYQELTAQIALASTGDSCPLVYELQSTGEPYTYAIISDTPPTITTYATYTEHSPFPSSIPSSAPSCGTGSEENSGGDGCRKCPAGSYSSIGGFDCKECDQGYYCDHAGCIACQACTYPWTTMGKGQTECHNIQLHIPGLIVYSSLLLLVVSYFIAIFSLSTQRLACLLIMTLPFFDVVTDMMYLSLSVFYDLYSFMLSILIITIIPNLIFLGVLIQFRAPPRLIGQQYLPYLLFLRSSPSGYPTFNGKEIFQSIAVHDSIIKLFYLFLCWLISCVAQVLALIPVSLLICFHLPFWIIWICLGTFLYQVKLLALGSIWNHWFEIWTGSNQNLTRLDLDTRIFNQSLLTEFLFESLPQLTLQSYNNTRLYQWTLLSYISTCLSLFMTLDGIWRIGYYKVYSGYSFGDIPVGMGLVKIVREEILKDTLKIHDGDGNGGGIEAGDRIDGIEGAVEQMNVLCIEPAERTIPSAPDMPSEETVQVLFRSVVSIDGIRTMLK